MIVKLSPTPLIALLGFAKKAGKVVSGDKAVRALLEKERICLLLVASDANPKRLESWAIEAEKAGVPIASACDKARMGLAIGASERTIAGVTDDAFAQAMMKHRME